MHIDIGRQLGAVNRGVTNREVEGKPARATTMAQTYATSPDDLWTAITIGGSHSAMAGAHRRRSAAGRAISTEGQRRRRRSWSANRRVI